MRKTALIGAVLGALAATAVPAAPAVAQDRSDVPNEARQLQRQAEYETAAYQDRLMRESFASFAESLAILARDPERQFLTDVCWLRGLGCAGDVRLYDWGRKGYGIVEPVLFTNRIGATISGHVWATAAGPPLRPAIVITSGSIQASEQMYWWAAQTLAKAGYVVITTDAQNQGRSDTQGEGEDANEGVPPQTQGNTFYDGTQDALDFLLSTPEHPYCPRPARSGRSHCAKQRRRAADGLNPAYNPFWQTIDPERVGLAGHSYGAQSVSYVGQQDPRVDAIVAWDNLCHPDGHAASRLDYGRGLPSSCGSGFQLPAPPLHTPALGISNDYTAGPLPPPTGNPLTRSGASRELSAAGVDSGEIVIRGGTHFEYSYLPMELFPATLRGIDLSAWYTRAWFDKYVKLDPDADRQLLTARWRFDPGDRRLDPAGQGNMLSFHYRSRLDVHLADGAQLVCEDMRSGCQGATTDDGGPRRRRTTGPSLWGCSAAWPDNL